MKEEFPVNADANLSMDSLRIAEMKRAMGCFATGVTVVTVNHDGEDHAMTCNSFNTVSLEPALVLWSIRHASMSLDAFRKGGGYSVSILGADDAALALKFARGSQAERLAGVETVRMESGRLRLAGAVAWFDCDLVQAVPAGDHDVLIGAVTAFAAEGGEPLVYVQGRFTRTLG